MPGPNKLISLKKCSGLSTVANIVAFEQYLLGFDGQVSELATKCPEVTADVTHARFIEGSRNLARPQPWTYF